MSRSHGKDLRFSGFTRWDAMLIAVLCAGIGLHFRFGWWEKPFAVQRRLADGAKVRLEDHIIAGWWWAGLLTLGLALLVAATRPLWMKPWPAPPRVLLSQTPRWLWIGLVAALVVAAGLRIPRLAVSLYADELYPLRTYISGQWTRNTDGNTKFKEVGWDRTLFDNREANNHILQSVASRAMLEAHRALTGAERSSFSETAMRLPSLAAGLASIFLLGLLLAHAGVPRAALIAVCLCALHPWHVRYCTEARGYAFAFFGATLAMLAALHASTHGRPFSWLGYGTGLFILLGSFPGSIYLVAALNAGVLLWCAVRGPGLVGIARLAVANAGAAAAFIWLYAPSAQQIMEYMRDPRALSAGLTGGWLLDEACYFIVGMPWSPDDPANPLLIGVTNATAWLHPAVGPAIAAVAGALCLAGFMRALVRPGIDGWALAASACAADLAILHCWLAGKLLFPWYLIFALPSVLGLVACGVDWIFKPAARRGWLSAAAFIAAFGLLCASQLGVLINHSREPNREVARALLPGSSQAELAGGFWTQAFNYDPRIRQIVTADDVARLIRESWGKGAVLRVGFGHRQRAVDTIPDALAMVETGELFSLESKHYGIDAGQFSHAVYRLRDGANEEMLTRALGAAQTKRLP